MDWGKAKNIFIIAFLILNISLGYQLYMKNIGNIQNMHWYSNNLEEVKEILNQQQIGINVDIPKEMPEMHFLQIKNKVVSSYDEIKYEKKEEIKDIYSIESILITNVNNFEQYKYNLDESNGLNYLVYNQTERNSIPFFGAKIEVYIGEDGTINYSQNYYEVMNEGLNREVISSYSALRTVLDQQLIPKGASIEEIELGYHGQTNQSSIQLLTPVWKISYSLNDEQYQLYVNAMTGGLQNVITY